MRNRLGYDLSDPRSSHGPRRRYKGKMGRLVGSGWKKQCVPRSHTPGGNSPAAAGWERGQPNPVPSKAIPAHCRVQLPPGRIRYVEPQDV